MSAVSIPSRQKSWQDPRQRVSVLAELAIHKKTVVDKLASLRDDHDLTQEKAAQAVGVTVRQWQRWESGASVPYPRNLDAIAERFGFPVAEFFTDDGPPAATPTATPSVTDRLDRIEQSIRDARTERHEAAQEIRRLLAEQADLLATIRTLVERLGIPDGITLQDHVIETVRDAAARSQRPERRTRS